VNWQELIKNKDLLRIIDENKDQNVASLALKWANKKDLFSAFVLNQIQGMQISKRKVPSWANCIELVYPDKTAMEQCSSELTAVFKSRLFEGKKVADLTGGLGIDSYFISLQADWLQYIEPDQHRFEVAQHNFEILGAKNVSFFNVTAENFLDYQELGALDYVYIDPSRRNENKNRVFLLKDMQPDLSLIIQYFQQFKIHMLIKLAPMLDIKAALKELNSVKKIYVVSVDDECKELLFDIDFHFVGPLTIQSVNITNEKVQSFEYLMEEEENNSVAIADATKYIYDPYSSLNKAGGFKSIASSFNLQKISNNTHLYTSNELINDFFGNCFEVIHVDDFSSRAFYAIENKKGVIKIRNFRMTQSEIEKKTKITYGPELFYFFFADADNRMKVATTKKVY